MKPITLLTLLLMTCSYGQRTCVAGNCQDGVGKMIFYNDPNYYYEGEFKNGKFHGNGRFFNKSGSISSGNWSENYQYGLGSYYDKGLIVLSHFKNSLQTEDRGLDYNLLKKHQDIAFSRFKKANLLTKTTVVLPWLERTPVDYDLIDEYGDKVGEKTEIESSLSERQFQGYVNNTGKNVYIRCYRKKYYSDTAQYEYIDDSFVLMPGEKVMSNFRLPPDNFLGYNTYLQENENAFEYLGQYYLEAGKKPLTIFEWEKVMGYGGIPTVADANVQPKPAAPTPVAPAKANVAPAQPAPSSLTPEQKQVIAATEKRLDEEDELRKYPVILFFDPSEDTSFRKGEGAGNLGALKIIAKKLQEHPSLNIKIEGFSTHGKFTKKKEHANARAYQIARILMSICQVDRSRITYYVGRVTEHPRGDVVEIWYH